MTPPRENSELRLTIYPDGTIVGPSGRTLRPFPDRDGYPQITTRTALGRQRRQSVHVLVCEAFHGPRPEGHEVAHLNGIRSDCRAANLAWKTPQGNSHDMIAHGNSLRGSRNPKAKLDENDIIAIRDSPESSSELAAIFGVDSSTIRSIRRRQKWRHVA